MLRIIYKLISSIASFIPTTNIILFHSFPDIADNSYAMCRYLHMKGYDQKFSFVWLISDKKKSESLNKILLKDGISAKLVKRISLRGLWLFIRARYIFVTHGLFDSIKLNQHPDKHVNLWHGMPLKLLGASEKQGKPSSTNFNYIVASSYFYQKVMAEAFKTSIDKVILTGQPRCDLLFEPTDWFESQSIDRAKYNKIGIWLPTYRRSIIGDIRTDGDYNDHGVSFLNEMELRKFDAFLQSEKILILLKIHPMDALQNVSFEEYTNLILIKPQNFKSQLYPLLGACDFLLTDYSSVFIDYQILRRPIGFVMNDISAYKCSRGFYFDDIEKVLPGLILSDLNKLCKFVKAPIYIENEINYNNYFDNCSAERICEHLAL